MCLYRTRPRVLASVCRSCGLEVKVWEPVSGLGKVCSAEKETDLKMDSSYSEKQLKDVCFLSSG